MINTFILPGILVFAVNFVLITLIFKGLVFLKFYRLLSWGPEVAAFLANTGMFYWFFLATPEEPEKRIFLIALTALVITWARPIIHYVLKDRKRVTFLEFLRWFSWQMVRRFIPYGAALFAAIYLSQGHFSFDFFTSRDVSATLSRFGFYAFWVCCLITAVYFISGLGLLALASRSNHGDHGFFLFKKIGDLDMEDTFSGITRVIIFTALMIDLVYLCVYFHMVWPAFIIIGITFFLPFYHEKNKNRETLIDGLGILIAMVYIGLILVVAVPASCMSLYHLVKILILFRTHDSEPTLAYFHALPMFKILLAGMTGTLFLLHQKLANRPATCEQPADNPTDNPDDSSKIYDNKSELIYQNRNEHIKGHSDSYIEKNDTVRIEGSRDIDVKKDVQEIVGNNFRLHVNQRATINAESLLLGASNNIQIYSSRSEVRIETHGASIVISENGDIRFHGKNITFHATGTITMNEKKSAPTDDHHDALINFETGNFNGAIHDFSKLLEREPNDVIAYKYRGLAYRHSGEPEKALSDLTQAIDLSSQNPDAQTFYSRGEIYRGMKEYTTALSDYDKACQIMPDNPDFVSSRGSVYYCMDLLDKAFADFNKALSLNPDHAVTCNELACIYALKEKGSDYLTFSQALEYAEKAVHMDRNWSTLDTLASVYASGGRFEEAVKTILEAYELLKANQNDHPYTETMEELIDAFRMNLTFLEWKKSK